MKRYILKDTGLLLAPGGGRTDWGLSLPCMKLANLFDRVVPGVHHIGWKSGRGRCYTYFKNPDERTIARVRAFAQTLEPLVFMDDDTDGAFALEMHQVISQPEQQLVRTTTGQLVYCAKYTHDLPTARRSAAAEIGRNAGQAMAVVLQGQVDIVCPVPSSSRSKRNDLPAIIGRVVADRLGGSFDDAAVMKTRPTSDIKNASLRAKRGILEGSFQVDNARVLQKRVLLVDDLYQSGTTVSVISALLRAGGATVVYAMTATKTLSNSDNVSRKVPVEVFPSSWDEDIPF